MLALCPQAYAGDPPIPGREASSRPLIYLDHNATTPLHPAVLEAMLAALRQERGNPSSLHAAGRQARAAIDEARREVALLVGVSDPAAICFTSGGSEADNHALRGVMAAVEAGQMGRLAISAVEHPAVRETAADLARRGVPVDELPVDHRGRLRRLNLAQGTRLVSVMAANNETGNLYDMKAVSAAAHAIGALVHTDAVQAAGKVPVDLQSWDVDLASLSAHKLGGPQGIGALYVRPELRLDALITGGGQEGGRRSGTENTAAIVGFGVAARLARGELTERASRSRRQRDGFEAHVLAQVPQVQIQGDRHNRLPNTSSMSILGITGEAMVMRLDAMGLAAATGSACSSGSGKPSPVLVAMGLADRDIQGALRVSVGWNTTDAEVERAATAVVAAAKALFALAPEEEDV